MKRSGKITYSKSQILSLILKISKQKSLHSVAMIYFQEKAAKQIVTN
jgi:hypothetical protein